MAVKPNRLSFRIPWLMEAGRGGASRHLRPLSARNFPSSGERLGMVVILG